MEHAVSSIDIFFTTSLTHQFLESVADDFAVKDKSLLKNAALHVIHFISSSDKLFNVVADLVFNVREVVKQLAVTAVANNRTDRTVVA